MAHFLLFHRIDSEGREFQLVGRLLPISTVEVAHRYQVYLELNHFKEWTAEGLLSDRRPRNKLRFWVDNFSASIFRLLEFKDPTGLWRSGNTEYNIENLEYDETECVMVEADSACGCGKVVELDPHQSTAPHRLLGFAPGAVTRSMTRAFTAAARQTVDRMRKRELEMRIR